MYGHYEYGSQHTVGGSSSQPNVGGSSSQPNSPVKEIEEIQVPVMQKKPNRRRQTAPKKKPNKEKTEDQHHVPWTPEEETALCKDWNSEEVPLFMQAREEKKNKRYKSSGSSSFNMKESGEGSINLNTSVGDEEDEVEEVLRPRPMDRDQAKRKMKAGSAGSSASSFDVEALAKMMASEYVMASDSYNIQKNQEMSSYCK
uniref:Uncharacterized protein n=1 Tax=Tanacetum cinerariifolium TaxID=118510 RepID=A0A6L2LSA7_TANCI|nr:hypothetical protein [Tanacetum cinerariifolium]